MRRSPITVPLPRHDWQQHSNRISLDNLQTLTQERVFFLSLPLNVESMDGTWVRAIAIEDEA